MIKYYEDLNYCISSGLDSGIHIHDIDKLSYKEGKKFNAHEKGAEAFFYSPKFRFIVSCGEEIHIIIWDPFTLGVLTKLHGHNNSVSNLAMNESRNHLLSLDTEKNVKVWDVTTYVCI